MAQCECEMIIIDNIFLFAQAIQRRQMQRGRELFRIACGYHQSIIPIFDMINYFMVVYSLTAPHSLIHTVPAELKATPTMCWGREVRERERKRGAKDRSHHHHHSLLGIVTRYSGWRRAEHRELIFMTINYTNMSINCNK